MSPLLTIGMVLALVLCGLNALFAWAFVWRYSRTTWHSYEVGRHLMRFTVVLAAMFSFTLAVNLLPLPVWVGVVASVVLFGASAVELFRRLRLVVVAQRSQRGGEGMRNLLKPKVRKWIYGIATAGLGVLGVYGIVDAEQAAAWGVLGAAVTGMAWANTDGDAEA